MLLRQQGNIPSKYPMQQPVWILLLRQLIPGATQQPLNLRSQPNKLTGLHLRRQSLHTLLHLIELNLIDRPDKLVNHVLIGQRPHRSSNHRIRINVKEPARASP